MHRPPHPQPSSLFGLRQPSPGVYRIHDRANGNLFQEHLCQNAVPPKIAVASAPDPVKATVDPQFHRDSQTLIGKLSALFCGVTVPFPWVLVPTNVCLCPPKSVSPVVWKFCYQILLTLKGRFPGDSLSPCQIPRFRSLNWV